MNYKITGAILILFHGCFSVSSKQISYEMTSAQLKRTDPECILRLYQLMKDVHEVFVLYKLRYWAAGGTLLGAVRNNGIIPWDTDLDIFIDQNDETKFLTLASLLNRLDYTLQKKRAYVYKIFPRKFPEQHVDVILTYQDNGKIFYSCKTLQERYRRERLPLYFTEQELYPLRVSLFGLFTIVVPNDPHMYLSYAYGLDYLTHADFQGEKVPLLERDKTPALPLGPLKDRI